MMYKVNEINDYKKYVDYNAYTVEWQYDPAVGGFVTNNTKVELRYCNQEDLKLFQKPEEINKIFLDNSWEYWLCIKNRENLTLKEVIFITKTRYINIQ